MEGNLQVLANLTITWFKSLLLHKLKNLKNKNPFVKVLR